MSIRAQVADLLGEDLFEQESHLPVPVTRVSVATAVRNCKPNEVVAARLGTRNLAVVALPGGKYFAVDDRCPHDGGLLSNGYVENGLLVCSRHGWEFSVENGKCQHRENCAIRTASLPALAES